MVDVIILLGYFFNRVPKQRPLTEIKGKFPLVSRKGVSELYIG